MNNRLRTTRRASLLAAAIAVSLASPLALAAGKPFQMQDYDQFIVKFKDGTAERNDNGARQKLLNEVARKQGLRIGQLRRMSLGADVIRTDRLLDPQSIKHLIGALRDDPRVEYAEVDERFFPAMTPTDPSYAGSQWHYQDNTAGIRAPAAWDRATGAGEVVAVIDTGVTAHTDLDDNQVAGYDFITSTTAANDGDGRDADPSDPGDWTVAEECGAGWTARNSSWHGTHVAGTVAAETNNGIGGAGVAFGAKVQHLRVLGKCGGSLSDIADAIVWASGGTVLGVSPNPTPAKTINMSLGGGSACGTTYQTAINTAVANGSTIVVAAGNSNSDVSGFRPASCDNVIAVAAHTSTGARSSFSNYGALIDISAPGSTIYSTLNAGTTTPAAESYANYNGTSMAAPHVAGVVALMRDAATTSLTPAEIESIIKLTARTQPVACPEGCGTGILDADMATLAATTPFVMVKDATNANEGDAGTTTRSFTIQLSAVQATDTTFDVATADGTATAGSDYVAKSLTGVTIPAGSTSTTFDVTVNGDTTAEADETFFVDVSNLSGGLLLLDDQATTTIINDDVTSLVNGVAVTGLAGAQGNEVFYKLDVPAGASNLNFAMSGGTGDADLYVRFGAKPTTSTWDCRPYSSGNSESCPTTTPAAGTYYVMIRAFSTYSGVSLVGSYDAPMPNMTIADTKNGESDSGTRLLTFTVSLSEASASDITFDIATANGTAKSGTDYIAKALTGQVIPAGQTTKTFQVQYTGDTEVEANETLYANITNVVGANVTDAQGRATILNDDGPYLQVTDASISEGNSGTKTLNFTVLMSEAAAVPVTFSATTANGTASAGSDYVAAALSGETIGVGNLSRAVSVTINGDTADEVNETLRFNISNAVGATIYDDVALGTILNDDGPTLSINDVVFGEGASGTTVATFTVTMSEVAAGAVSFTAATSPNEGTATPGVDFTAKSLNAQSIPAGMLSKTFTVDVAGDANVEANETFYVNLSGANGGATILDKQGKGTILNDDGANLRVSNVSVSEGNAGTKAMTFTVSTPVAAAGPIGYTISTSNGTATAGSDYIARSEGGEVINAGLLSKTFVVTINGDTTAEGNETLKATLSNVTGATVYDSQGIGTITNDD